MTRRIVAALTIDDAPSIAGEGAVAFDASRMDKVRIALKDAGIARCVAFVIGAHALACETQLTRWLASGYELGNHSQDHVPASKVERSEFTASIARCDALLASVGAFDQGRPRYFRFPFGDRGRTPAQRRDLIAACADLGYTLADVSIYLQDHHYEAPLAAALDDRSLTRATEERYLATARRSTRRAARLGRRLGTGHVHVMACHFGLVTQRTLRRLLAELASEVRWAPLHDAVSGAAYARHFGDPERNGMLADELRFAPEERLLRPLARLSRRRDWFDQQALGPRWPHLQY